MNLDRWSDEMERRHPVAYPLAVLLLLAVLVYVGYLAARA